MKRLTPAKLFIDGGDPKETAEATRLLNAAGYAGLDGQTTNPSLIAKNPGIKARIDRGEKLTKTELLAAYRAIVQEIEKSAPGDISIEVYADVSTRAGDLMAQAREMATWIRSAVVKLPTTPAGLLAAEQLKAEMRLNLTLCFSQAQAAAVYAATAGSAFPVFVSPFIGRLDDRGENGLQLVENMLRMYAAGDGHVHVLTASVRSVDHILGALMLGTQAMTMPFAKAFTPWADAGFPLSDARFQYRCEGKEIPYEEISLESDWRSYDLRHPLTDSGLQKFADDWNVLLAD
jgi:transaldolase